MNTTCLYCSTPHTCSEKRRCKPATWTDSPVIGGFPDIQEPEPAPKEPVWIVYGLIGAVAFVLVAKFLFT